MPMKVLMVTVGTRPEIIKMAPIVRALKSHRIPFIFVHCGQHYDYNMSQQFIEDLELPTPDYSFRIRASTQGEQTARIIMHTERLIQRTNPAAVLAEGERDGFR